MRFARLQFGPQLSLIVLSLFLGTSAVGLAVVRKDAGKSTRQTRDLDQGATPSPAEPAGMKIVPDEFHREATHACAEGAANCAIQPELPPAGLWEAPAMPAPVKALVRRDAVIFYLPVVAGAQDYRAYIVNDQVGFQNGDPVNAVIACAGYRQYPRKDTRVTIGGVTYVKYHLMRQLELPGLNRSGSQTVVIEAIDRICPFTGVPGYKDAEVAVTGYRQLRNVMDRTFKIVSYGTANATNGNEILNGQGASSDFVLKTGQKRGRPMPYTDPKVLARTVVKLTTPAPDEATDAPLNDLDPANGGLFDDFSENESVSLAPNRGPFNSQHWVEGSDPSNKWFFWVNAAQRANGDTDDDSSGAGVRGAQIWKRHGRLNITFADYVQETMGGVHFTSLTKPTLEMRSDSYIHSFWRVDSNGTMRRYWHWMVCGADSEAKLIDPVTKKPRVKYFLQPGFYENGGADSEGPDPSQTYVAGLGGINPSARNLLYNDTQTDAHNQECVQMMQFDGMYQAHSVSGKSRWLESSLRAVISPAGKEFGVHSLNPTPFSTDFFAGSPAYFYQVDANKQYLAPLVDPWTLPGLQTHFDAYVNRERMVLYINGRMAACWNFDATRPLTMNRAKVVYGQVLYHTDAEYGDIHKAQNGYSRRTGQFHYVMNTPASDTKTWDSVGESEGVAIPDPIPGRTPAQGGFDPSRCFTPDPLNWRHPVSR